MLVLLFLQLSTSFSTLRLYAVSSLLYLMYLIQILVRLAHLSKYSCQLHSWLWGLRLAHLGSSGYGPRLELDSKDKFRNNNSTLIFIIAHSVLSAPFIITATIDTVFSYLRPSFMHIVNKHGHSNSHSEWTTHLGGCGFWGEFREHWADYSYWSPSTSSWKHAFTSVVIRIIWHGDMVTWWSGDGSCCHCCCGIVRWRWWWKLLCSILKRKPKNSEQWENEIKAVHKDGDTEKDTIRLARTLDTRFGVCRLRHHYRTPHFHGL